MFESVDFVLNENQKYHDYLLRKVFTFGEKLSESVLLYASKKKWFQPKEQKDGFRPEEEHFAFNMHWLSKHARNAVTVSQLFVPQSNVPVEAKSLGTDLTERVLQYADFAKIYAKLATENDFKKLTGPATQRFSEDMFIFTNYAIFATQRLMLKTQMIIKGQVEASKKYIGEHAGPYAMYAQALENTYDWQMLHGTFVPDITADDITSEHVNEVRAQSGQAIEPQVLQVNVRDWLAGQIFNSQLLEDLRSHKLVLPDTIQFGVLAELRAETIATYNHGVLLFLYRLSLEYDRLNLESKLNPLK